MKFFSFCLLICVYNATAGRVIGLDVRACGSCDRINECRAREVVHICSRGHLVEEIGKGALVSVAERDGAGGIGVHNVVGVKAVVPDAQHVSELM